jgi:hypothetical protein
MTTDETNIRSWQSLHQLLRGYRAAQVAMTCTQLGVFRHLADGARTAAALAGVLGVNAEALRRLLNAASALRLVTKIDDQYANSPLADTCLARDGRFFIGHMAGLEQANYERWGRLPEAIHSGRWPEPNRQVEDRGDWVRRFELAMYDMARVSAPAIAAALDLPVDRPLRLIDVGGGHGGYSMALARRYPLLTAGVFELPAAAEVAREIIAAEGMSDRVTVQSGDFQREALGQGYDVALVFGVLVSESPDGRRELLRKLHSALAPGGLIVIREMWLDADDPARFTEAALFSLHMLLSNSVGDVATMADIGKWLTEAGFDAVHEVVLPGWAGGSLCGARKPG